MAFTKQERNKAEALVYEVMDTLDKTKTNSEHYKKIFANASDSVFESMFKKKFPLKFHITPWVIEPTMTDIKKALNILKAPMTEKIRMPYFYINAKGEAVQTKFADVIYIHVKRLQQLISKKNSMSTNIDQRDMKTGLLLNFDANGKTSDRESEAMITMGLSDSVTEFTTFRADSMNSKNTAYSIINTTGILYQKDIPNDAEDSLAKNLFNVYLIGAMLYSNILTDSYVLPYTAKNRKKEISRG